MAHSPLYADHAEGWRYVAWTRFHCTLGDVLILLGAFWATAALFRSWRWPVTRSRLARVFFTLFGLGYTIWSEWFNASVRDSWAYAPEMPQVLGIGLSPILQWLVVPTVLLIVLRHGRSAFMGGIDD